MKFWQERCFANGVGAFNGDVNFAQYFSKYRFKTPQNPSDLYQYPHKKAVVLVA